MYDKLEILQALQEYLDANDFPMVQEFCVRKDMPSRDTINVWCKDEREPELSKRFSDIVKRINTKQEVFLVKSNTINPIKSIFLLKQPTHGYVDRQEINQTVTVNATDAIAAARARVQLMAAQEPVALAQGVSDQDIVDAVVVDNEGK